MSPDAAREELRKAILEGDESGAANIANDLVQAGSGIEGAVETAVETIRTVGDRFGAGEIFLPEMVLAADAMLAFMNIVSPYLQTAAGQPQETGKIILGTVKGDIHSIGKDIVATMLKASGFEVVDMGVDVAPMDLIKTAEQSNGNIIGLSSLMTTSMPYQKEVIELLNALSKRDDYWVIVGGGPVTVEYAEEIGANGWAANAAAAARLCERLVSSDGSPASAEFIFEEK